MGIEIKTEGKLDKRFNIANSSSENNTGVVIGFVDTRMPEYFTQWFNEVGRESFEASLIDINE